MRLADGRQVPDLPLDRAKVERCRTLADRITDPVLESVRRHTTVSIERTVLRLLGLHDAGPRGIPLVNLAVDALQERGLLGRGAAYWLGYVLRRGAGDPIAAVERLAALPARPEPLPEEEERALRAEVRREAEGAVGELLRRVAQRDALKAELGVGPRPHKYLIVATGNIHDDVEQARAAAQAGADVIAVIRSTAQSLLDYVPHGATTEGFGGTYATQENFRIMREALDDESRRLRRYVHLTNYSSGLCMPEIAFAGAWERLDMLLNDAMYGILFRDINMCRTFVDQYVSRRIVARSGIVINTGEDNYLTTADAVEKAHTVVASQFINEAFALRAGLREQQMGLGHAYEIDPWLEDSFLLEIAQAQLVRQIFDRHPIKWMPPTKHKTGDIFFAHVHDALFDLVGVATKQSIELLGMFSEAIQNPLLMDRYLALKATRYVHGACRHLGDEIEFRSDGIVARRAEQVLDEALQLLVDVKRESIWEAIARGAFADVKRTRTGGKGYGGVIDRAPDYLNPFLDALERA